MPLYAPAFPSLADDEHEKAGGNGVERAAVTDLALVEPAANEVDDVVGGFSRRFVDQEQAIELGDHLLKAVGYRLQAVAY